MTQPLTSADPEPPPYTTVVTEGGTRWTRAADMWPGSWLQEGHEDGDPETWTKVAGNYGPVTVEIKDEDLYVESTRTDGYSVRVTHLPSGESWVSVGAHSLAAGKAECIEGIRGALGKRAAS